MLGESPSESPLLNLVDDGLPLVQELLHRQARYPSDRRLIDVLNSSAPGGSRATRTMLAPSGGERIDHPLAFPP